METLLADPNIAFLLVTLGLYGLIYEFAVPGGFVAGTLGIILLMLGGYGLKILPFSIFGLSLVAAGILVMAVEAFIRARGLLALTGALIFALGAFLLFNQPDHRLSWVTIASTTVLVAGGLTFLLMYVVRLYRHPAQDFSLNGQTALVVDWNDETKRIEIDGAYWRARSLNDKHYSHGDWVTVQGQDKLTLLVE